MAVESAERAFATAGDLCAGLRKLFPAEAYAVLFDVADGTGGRITRRADALVQSLYPSRGLWLAGVENKVSRADWLRELREPAKADAIARFCDHWYVCVSDAAIVQPGELPEGWGLIAPHGDALRIKVPAGKLDAAPMTPLFRAALLRAAQGQTATAEMLKQARAEGYREAKAHAEAKRASDRAAAERERAERGEALAKLEEVAGPLSRWNAEDVGRAMAFYRSLRRHSTTTPARAIGTAGANLRRLAGELDVLAEAVNAAIGTEEAGDG